MSQCEPMRMRRPSISSMTASYIGAAGTRRARFSQRPLRCMCAVADDGSSGATPAPPSSDDAFRSAPLDAGDLRHRGREQVTLPEWTTEGDKKVAVGGRLDAL